MQQHFNVREFLNAGKYTLQPAKILEVSYTAKNNKRQKQIIINKTKMLIFVFSFCQNVVKHCARGEVPLDSVFSKSNKKAISGRKMQKITNLGPTYP
jgi:hypothetical protein